jgi:hypothetical protein
VLAKGRKGQHKKPIFTMEQTSEMINHLTKKRCPIKAIKKELLKFTKDCEIIIANDLVDHLGDNPEIARGKLYALAREGLIISRVSPGVCKA